jgi:hypothetical protein
VTLNETLAARLRLVGQRVSISAAGIDGDPPPALTITGTSAEGTELLRDLVGAGEECIYLSFEEDRGAGLFVHSSVFRGAAWEGCESTSAPWHCGWNGSAIDVALALATQFSQGLLRQPGGFEGLVPGKEHLQSDDLFTLKGPDVADGRRVIEPLASRPRCTSSTTTRSPASCQRFGVYSKVSQGVIQLRENSNHP